MSFNYATQLTNYSNKGELGMPLEYDSKEELQTKFDKLDAIVKQSKNWAVLTGAGISVSCGIPDFRSPDGIWTRERDNREVPDMNFVNVKPSYTHYAITALERVGLVKHLVSQNVDGLHLKSGFPMERICEPHGNSFVAICDRSHRTPQADVIPSLGQKKLGQKCPHPRCRSDLRDSVLDWDQELFRDFYTVTQPYVKACDFLLILGTSLQIEPVSLLPDIARRAGAKVVIVTLQKMKRPKDLVIYADADKVMKHIMSVVDVDDFASVYHSMPILKSIHNVKDDTFLNEKKRTARKRPHPPQTSNM